MKFINGSVTERTYTLLKNVDYLRASKPLFIKHYYFSYPTDTTNVESLARAWRLVQQHFPEVRREKWEEDQKHTVFV